MTRLAGFIIILLLSFNAYASAGYVSQGGLTWMPVTSKSKSWEDANAYCANSGWRLPTKDELIALRASGAMNGQGWELGYTWSSTPGSAGEHYYVVLANSIVEPYKDTYSEGYLTCVNKTNSAVATPPAKPKPAQAQQSNGGLQLIVTDHGAGIAEKAKAEKKFAQEQQAQVAADRAERKAEAAKRAAADAAREEKQKAWCMADQTRLTLCTCSKYSSLKGSACGK